MSVRVRKGMFRLTAGSSQNVSSASLKHFLPSILDGMVVDSLHLEERDVAPW